MSIPASVAITHDDPSQSRLGVRCHGIGLVQNDDLEGRIWILFCVGAGIVSRVFLSRRRQGRRRRPRLSPPKEALPAGTSAAAAAAAAGGHARSDGQAGKLLDLLPDHADPPFVAGVELQDAAPPLRGVPQLPAQGQRNAGLATTRRPVEQKVRQPAAFDGVAQHGDDLGLVGDVVEGLRTVPFHPRRPVGDGRGNPRERGLGGGRINVHVHARFVSQRRHLGGVGGDESSPLSRPASNSRRCCCVLGRGWMQAAVSKLAIEYFAASRRGFKWSSDMRSVPAEDGCRVALNDESNSKRR